MVVIARWGSLSISENADVLRFLPTAQFTQDGAEKKSYER